MPCYSVQTCTVELNNAKHDLLEKALKKLGYSVYRNASSKSMSFSKDGVTGTYENKKLSFSYSSKKPDTDAIKRAYSEEVIKQRASEYAEEGWEVEQDGEWTVMKHPSSGYGVVHA